MVYIPPDFTQTLVSQSLLASYMRPLPIPVMVAPSPPGTTASPHPGQVEFIYSEARQYLIANLLVADGFHKWYHVARQIVDHQVAYFKRQELQANMQYWNTSSLDHFFRLNTHPVVHLGAYLTAICLPLMLWVSSMLVSAIIYKVYQYGTQRMMFLFLHPHLLTPWRVMLSIITMGVLVSFLNAFVAWMILRMQDDVHTNIQMLLWLWFIGSTFYAMNQVTCVVYGPEIAAVIVIYNVYDEIVY
jgi:hypothetical protein